MYFGVNNNYFVHSCHKLNKQSSFVLEIYWSNNFLRINCEIFYKTKKFCILLGNGIRNFIAAFSSKIMEICTIKMLSPLWNAANNVFMQTEPCELATEEGIVNSISNSTIIASLSSGSIHELVSIGNSELIGEIIKINGDDMTIQVFDNTCKQKPKHAKIFYEN